MDPEKELKDAPSSSFNPSNKAIAVAGSSAIVGGSVPLVCIATVKAIGFGAGGITAGSMAAGMMATEAVAGGGAIAAGGTVASLQWVGAVGFASGFATAGIVTASVGAVALLGVRGWGALRGTYSPPRSIVSNEGPLAIYSGFSAGVARQLSYGMTRFGLYSVLMDQYSAGTKVPFLTKLCFGSEKK